MFVRGFVSDYLTSLVGLRLQRAFANAIKAIGWPCPIHNPANGSKRHLIGVSSFQTLQA
jgi:hypothetical protein